MRQKTVKKAGKHFSVEDQHKIIQEMISSGCTKREIWKKSKQLTKPEKLWKNYYQKATTIVNLFQDEKGIVNQ